MIGAGDYQQQHQDWRKRTEEEQAKDPVYQQMVAIAADLEAAGWTTYIAWYGLQSHDRAVLTAARENGGTNPYDTTITLKSTGLLSVTETGQVYRHPRSGVDPTNDTIHALVVIRRAYPWLTAHQAAALHKGVLTMQEAIDGRQDGWTEPPDPKPIPKPEPPPPTGGDNAK